jgi:hypothetical protein
LLKGVDMSRGAVLEVTPGPELGIERRRSPRCDAEDGRGRIKLRLGHEVAVINMSRDGILIEGSARLRPGYRVELQMDTSASYLHALIARCEVSVLDENGVTYRAGLTFI